jgi:hypothetical protein
LRWEAEKLSLPQWQADVKPSNVTASRCQFHSP